MPLDPRGFTPPIPAVTKTEGAASPDALDSIGRMAMMLGQRPQSPISVGDKMAQVVQLLREISQSDPRLAGLAGTALQALTQGPPPGFPNMPGAANRGMGMDPSTLATIIGATAQPGGAIPVGGPAG